MQAPAALIVVRLVHTAAWMFFAGCIALLPLAAHAGRFDLAAFLAGAILFEILVLAMNRWRCPLTGIAARYTSNRQDNFDIYLPHWLARYNKEIFGSLFLAGLAYAVFEWRRRANGA
jgi:hypothetical protein